MSRTTQCLAVGAAAVLALVGVAGPAAAKNGQQNRPVQPHTHSVEYWEALTGTECTKTEYPDGTREFDGSRFRTVYIKAGTEYYGTHAGHTGLIETDRDISFVITCGRRS